MSTSHVLLFPGEWPRVLLSSKQPASASHNHCVKVCGPSHASVHDLNRAARRAGHQEATAGLTPDTHSGRHRRMREENKTSDGLPRITGFSVGHIWSSILAEPLTSQGPGAGALTLPGPLFPLLREENHETCLPELCILKTRSKQQKDAVITLLCRQRLLRARCRLTPSP